MCCKVLYFILSEDDFEIKSKIYSLNLRLVLNHILNSQDVLSFRNLFFFTLFDFNFGNDCQRHQLKLQLRCRAEYDHTHRNIRPLLF